MTEWGLLELLRQIIGARRDAIHSVRLAGHERISEDFELSCFLLTACTPEGVNRRPDPDVEEPDVFKHFLPGCARQTTGNSSGPKIDVVNRRLGHRFAVGNIRELKTTAWT